MKLFLIFELLLLQTSVTSLEHLKSYLLQDGSSNVAAISIYEDSVLFTASSDVVQKDLDTGAIKRSFRAHSGQVNAFIVLKDSKMISSGWDDMIIVWDLLSGSVLKRTWLGSFDTRVEVVVLQNDIVYAAGLDKRIRRVDMITGTISVLEQNVAVNTIVVKDDFLIVSLRSVDNLVKIDSSTGSFLHAFIGHSNSVFALQLSGNYLFSGSADTSIICWNVLNGDKLRTFNGHIDEVHSLLLVENFLYSGGSDLMIFKWDIESGQMMQEFPRAHTNIIRCLAQSDGLLLSGSNDATIIKWNATTGSFVSTFRGLSKKIWSVVFWNGYVVTGGDDSNVLVWDASANYLAPTAVLYAHRGPVNCLFVYENALYSGSSDKSVMQWNLSSLLLDKSYHGHSKAVTTVMADDVTLYSGSNDLTIRSWNISSGNTVHVFIGHTDYVSSLQMILNSLYSSSFDKTIKEWSKTSFLNTKTVTYPSSVFVILIFGNSIVAGSYGIAKFDMTSGAFLGSQKETIGCLALVSKGDFLYGGQADSAIRVRDFNTLSVLETYQGHLDSVVALSFDISGNLYSASFDGSAKRWNMLSRRIAFSFENRNASVTSLVAYRDALFVGTRNGVMNMFGVQDAILRSSLSLHKKTVTSLLLIGNELYSAGLDGLILKQALDNGLAKTVVSQSYDSLYHSLILLKEGLAVVDGDFKILLLPTNSSLDSSKTISSSVPIICIDASEKYITAGTKLGSVFGWDLTTLELSFTLKKHTSQINALLVHEDWLFSASDDKTIINWSIQSKQVSREFKRSSSRALGHLGPVSCLAVCNRVLFSGGLDTTTRRWNLNTGVHEAVYFGPSKAVNVVTCHNNSLFVGSDDFSVLMFKPDFPAIYSASTSKNIDLTRTQRKLAKKIQSPSKQSEENTQNLILIVGVAAVAVVSVIAALYSFRG